MNSEKILWYDFFKFIYNSSFSHSWRAGNQNAILRALNGLVFTYWIYYILCENLFYGRQACYFFSPIICIFLLACFLMSIFQLHTIAFQVKYYSKQKLFKKRYIIISQLLKIFMQQTLPEIKIPEIKCQGKHRARLSCIDVKCDQKAFICLKDQCNFCQSNHKQCKTGWIDSIVQKIIEKRLLRTPGLDEAILTTEKIYNQAFELVQRQRDGFKAQIENYGLNFDEIRLLENLQKGKTDQIIGKSVHGAFRELQDVCLFQRDQQALMAYWEDQAKKIQQVFQRLKLLRKSVGITEIKSSILKKFEEKMTLQSFFSHPIVTANLLFRASQHDFQAKTFHQICDGIPNTLTIAVTQFGKIVGGFTTIPWNKDCVGTTQYSQQSFLFSITNKEKYKFFSYQNCTFGQPDFGPTFGNSENGGYDLNIPTKSNSKNFGAMQLGSTYQKPKKIQNLAKHLIGSDSLAKVKFMEWQVFEIQFLNPQDLLNEQKKKKSQFEGKVKTTFGGKRRSKRIYEDQ